MENNGNISGYKLSRDWWDFAFANPEKIKPNHSAIFFFAVEHCNRLGWKQKFGFPTTMVMEATGIKSYNTFIKTLNEIVEWGFIEMIQKSKNQYSANIIALSNFNKAVYKSLDEALIKHDVKQHESEDESEGKSIDSIDKQQTTKPSKPNNQLTTKQKVYSDEIHACLKNCLKFFPEHLHPEKENTWLDTLEKLNRIEKIPLENIEWIVEKTRNDNFWAKNFMSLTKLRKKNKEDIMYIVVFNENFKNNGQQGNQKGASTVSESYVKSIIDNLQSE